jgi:hypothetical protein
VRGDKEGGLWFVDRTTPNGFSNFCPKNCTCLKLSGNVQTYWTDTPYRGAAIHGGPAFWEYDRVTPFLNYMFAAEGGTPGGQLVRYPLCADPHAKSPIDLSSCASSPARLGRLTGTRHKISLRNYPLGFGERSGH